MSEPKPLSDGDVEPYAKYHAERASDGGASAEFHARAETFLRAQAAKLADMEKSLEDVRADRDAALAELVGMKDHFIALDASVETAREERDEALGRLPEAMAGCTILFKECERGHGRLMATNWIDHGCPFCEIARLKPSGQVAEDVAIVRRGLAVKLLSDADAPFQIRGEEALPRLAAKAQGYEAALADQARGKAIAEQADTERAYAQAQTQHERSLKDAAVADNAEMVARALAVESDTSTSAQRQKVARHIIGDGAHPGSALLEQHRKEVEALKEALKSQQDEGHTLRRAFLHERDRADAAGAPPEHAYNARWAENLVADEHKALVRARNEGREQIASWLGKQWGEYELAERARAMKEPEE